LNRRAVSPEEQVRFFRYMLEDVERLDQLINHLLVTARLQRPAVAEGIEEVEVEPLLRQCVEDVRQRYQAAHEVFRLRIERSVVRARRADLDMIFRNLIDNAIKYAGDPPQVQIVSQPRPDGHIVTQVIDNGRGIPLRSRHKVFGRFIRLGSELEREKPGTGLGLYIVETLVRRLRGTVRVTDPLAGCGTMFEVILPGWTRESPIPAPSPVQDAEPQPAA
jgi:signal transduction histidine kinase